MKEQKKNDNLKVYFLTKKLKAVKRVMKPFCALPGSVAVHVWCHGRL